MTEMGAINFLKEKMLYIVFTLIFLSSYAGLYHREMFLSLKWTLPVALFMMLFQPMVFMNIRKAFTTRIRNKDEVSCGPDGVLRPPLPRPDVASP